MTKLYCPECGFQNTEEGNYCSRCGALLPEGEDRAETTLKFSLGTEEREAEAAHGAEALREGTHLVVRSGGDMAGEVFEPVNGGTTIGRKQDSDIFLDDITVSRNHAILYHRDDGYYIEDQGSLNGTYINRARVETQKLADGDQLQIGKYKLTFIQR